MLGSGPFVEGWAVYSEWLMASKGFGGAKVRLQQQKMILRTTANAILDHGIHAGDMDERQAMELMTRDAFQEEGEAAGKWSRARLTSAQLTTYFYGFSEMMKLREAAQGLPVLRARVPRLAPVPRLARHALPAWDDGGVAGLKPRAVRRRGPRAGESAATCVRATCAMPPLGRGCP